MAKGKKTGGRIKGTVNKDKQELIDMIQEKFPDYHPLMAMAEIANSDVERYVGEDNDDNPILVPDNNLKFQASKEICKYIVPQLKSIDNTYELPEGKKFTLKIE